MSLADGTPESGLALWSLSFSRQHLSAHIFSSFVLILCSQSPSPSSHTPILTPAPSLLNIPHLLSWKTSMPSSEMNGSSEIILETWIHPGLGRIQGEKMASLGIPFHPVKYTQKHTLVIFSVKSCVHAGSYSENKLHLDWRWPNHVRVKAIARRVIRRLGNWGRQVKFFTTEKEVLRYQEGPFVAAVVSQPRLACSRR